MSTPQEKQKPEVSDEEFLKLARDRFDLAAEAFLETRKEAADDLKFAAGEQWPPDMKAQREQDKRPCLTINRLPQSIHQITNDQRQNRPAIKVSPVDDKADKKTAKIYQGMIRHIEYSSDADTAYDTGFDSAVRCGHGFWRVITQYEDPMSFDQEIRIKRVPDRFSVYMDPSYQEPDGSDANWAFVFEEISRDAYKALYPESELASMADWDALANDRRGWIDKGTVRIAEYFYKDFERTTIVLLAGPNGDKIVAKKADLEKAVKSGQMLPQGMKVLAERETTLPVVKWCKMNGVEKLEESDWAGRWIPVVPVHGEEQIIEGQRILSGIVRHAKDPQRMYNYWSSSETEAIALAPRAPFIGAAGQFKGFEGKWAQANVKNFAFLEYNPTSSGTQPVPPPQRQVFEPAVQAISQARMLSSDDIKATTGIYDAALGNRSNENSGVAIQRRNVQAQTSNFHFVDNLSKSIRHTGRILVDLIPKIYDTARAVRILGEDGTEEVVRINEIFQHKGEQVQYNLGAGKYDVTVSQGPSFETKRQEAAAAMLDFFKIVPQHAVACSDLLVKAMDFPGADDLAERLRKLNGIEDDEKAKAIPPQVQAQMAQMGQMVDALTAQLNDAKHKLETKTIELESKERIEISKLKMQAELKLAELGSTEALAMLSHQMKELQQRLALVSFNEPIETENSAGPSAEGLGAESSPQPTGGFSPGTPVPGGMTDV